LLIGLVAVLSGAAGAAVETPGLSLEGSPSLRGGNTLILTLDFPAGWQGAVDLRVPTGYTGTARPVPFGTEMSHLTLEGVRPDGSTVQRSGGRVTVEGADNFTAECAPGSHAAVWLLAGELDEQPFSAPIFVDEGADGFRLRLCPDLRLGSLRVTSLVIATKAFWNPRAAGEYVWRATFTGGTEAQARVRLPVRVQLRSAKRRGGDVVVVRGRATEGAAGLPGANVTVFAKHRSGSSDLLGTVRSGRDGSFTVKRRSRTFQVFAVARVPARPGACVEPAHTCTATIGGTFPIKTNAVDVR
jgi:hypothetical protein